MLLVVSSSLSFAQSKIEALSVPLTTISNMLARLEPVHPSLFGKAADFERLRQQTLHTELGKMALAKLIRDSDHYLQEEEPLQRTLVGGKRLSRDGLYRATTGLSMCYRLTGNPKYLKRCEAELLNLAAFSDWSPLHFLDTAEVTLAVATGYDWLYHDLAPESRDIIRQAILEKGLRPSLKYTHWVRLSNNWAQVCHAGIMAGALATFEHNSDISAGIIHRAIRNLPYPMSVYAPKGAYPEGPGYWAYGTGFNVLALDMLLTHLNTDFGLSTLPGFEDTMDYLNIITGPSGETFNYADGGSRRGSNPALWWFARHYKRPDILKYFELDAFKKYCASPPSGGDDGGGSRLFAMGLLWLQTPPADLKIKTPLHWSSESKEVITVHRTSWDDQKALFVAFKGGSPSESHGQMEVGSFVLDYAGIRWGSNTGGESYNRIEQRGWRLWDYAQNSNRWKIFRLNNFSKNTLVIDNQLQLASGRATLKSFKAEPAPETVLDLTPVYQGQASKIIRAGKLLPSGEFQITDTLAGLKPGAIVRWALLTTAQATLNDTPVMILTKNGETLKLTLKHDAAARWKIIDAEKPRNEWDSPNKGYRQITFETIAPENGELTLEVLITPGG